jgi:flagellar biosynthesis protein FlhF
VEELKQVLLRSMGTKPAERVIPPEQVGNRMLETLTAELQASGVGEQEIRTLMAPVTAAAARGEGERRLRELLKESITASIQCALSLNLKKGEARIVAMVGPTGVGKTTTIAKLAARAYKHGVKVALITIDTFRIGAVAQLETYSGIMGLPLEVASTPAELAEALAAHADKQLIFIDTAGRSPRDREKLQELKSFLNMNPAIEVHLCLAATTRDNELARTVARFGVLPVSRLLFTKLDESESFGSIVNVHLRDKVPLSYFTTGQKVPEDIEAATAGKVAELLIGETKP